MFERKIPGVSLDYAALNIRAIIIVVPKPSVNIAQRLFARQTIPFLYNDLKSWQGCEKCVRPPDVYGARKGERNLEGIGAALMGDLLAISGRRGFHFSSFFVFHISIKYSSFVHEILIIFS